MRRLLPFLVALLAMWGVAACGGGNDKDDVIADADQICADAKEDLDRIEEELEGETDLNALADPIRESEERVSEAIDDLKDLDPPDEDRDTWDEFIEANEDQLDLFGDLADAAEDGDTSRVQELVQEGEELDDRANEAAEEYGMDDCAQDDDDEDEGTSTDEGTDTEGGLSGDEAIAQGDEICARAEQEIESQPTPTSADEFGPWARDVQGILDQAVADFEALSPPPDIESDFDEYVSTLEEASSLLEQLTQAAEARDQARLQELASEFQELGTRSDQLARDIGFDTCAAEG